MNRLGVVGWPVAHSRSPAIQNAALRAAGLERSWRYQLLPVPPELFDETVSALPASGFRGVNVTIPHKQAALALATTASARATAIGAANTLVFGPNGTIRADNTDSPALIEALTVALQPPDQSSPQAGRTALVLGAGGTARAAVWALSDAGFAVTVWNRTAARAAELCASVGGSVTTDVTAVGAMDVIINCTSIGLNVGDSLADLPVDPLLMAQTRLVVDFVYRDGDTPLIEAAKAAGLPTVSGLELLVGQGALSFEMFTGTRASRPAMLTAIGLSSAR